jgi:hypothetical protein
MIAENRSVVPTPLKLRAFGVPVASLARAAPAASRVMGTEGEQHNQLGSMWHSDSGEGLPRVATPHAHSSRLLRLNRLIRPLLVRNAGTSPGKLARHQCRSAVNSQLGHLIAWIRKKSAKDQPTIRQSDPDGSMVGPGRGGIGVSQSRVGRHRSKLSLVHTVGTLLPPRYSSIALGIRLRGAAVTVTPPPGSKSGDRPGWPFSHEQPSIPGWVPDSTGRGAYRMS